MTETELRRIIVDALAEASVFQFRRLGIAESFIEGTADAAFEDLEADSLARMELCIAIEANTGVEVLPAHLEELGTLGNVVALVRQRQKLVETYERMVEICRSVNQLNAVNTLFEGTTTPPEVLHLWNTIANSPGYLEVPSRLNQIIHPALLQATILDWINKLKGFHDLSGKPLPEPFGRLDISKTLTVHTAGGPPEGKTLLICFTGSGHRVMMPTPTFLQALDASRVDVAILRDIPYRRYRGGLEGVSPTVDDIGPHLAFRLKVDTYRRVAVLGISGGCVAGLLASVKIKAEAVAVVGIVAPDDAWWLRHDGATAGTLIRDEASRRGQPTATYVYGAQSLPDEAAARAFAEFLPGRLEVVSSKDVVVGHNALFPLLKDGQLAGRLEDWLGV